VFIKANIDRLKLVVDKAYKNEEDSQKDEGRSRKLFSSDDNEGEDNEKDEDDDDEYEICESESTSN